MLLGLLGRQCPRRLHVLDALGLPERVPNQHLLPQGLHQPQIEPLPIVVLAAAPAQPNFQCPRLLPGRHELHDHLLAHPQVKRGQPQRKREAIALGLRNLHVLDVKIPQRRPAKGPKVVGQKTAHPLHFPRAEHEGELKPPLVADRRVWPPAPHHVGHGLPRRLPRRIDRR